MNNVPGKIPPQAIDLEEAVLGSLILEEKTFQDISDIISPESFYVKNNKTIALAIWEMAAQNQNIDLLTISNKLKTMSKLDEVGGAYKLSQLCSSIGSTAHIEEHARIIQEKYLAREMIRISSVIQAKAYNDTTDVFELMANAVEAFSKLSGFNSNNIHHISEGFEKITAQIDKNINNPNHLSGIPSGLDEWDKFSSGFQPGELYIIAGESSNGKTALALKVVAFAALLKYKCAVYSREMSLQQLSARILSSQIEVSSKAIQYYKLNEMQIDRVQRGIKELEKAPIYIDEMTSSKYDYLERSIRIMVLHEGIQLVVIDYLQLITPNDSRKNKVDAIADISNSLKNLALQLKVPIILVSQLSRDKMNPEPTLSRLKGSGDIENAADVVWLLWQPARYGRLDFECKSKNYGAEGLVHNIIAKGRNIGITEFVTHFEGQYTRFKNYEATNQPINSNPY